MAPSSVLLPTPEPAKRPTRCPSPSVSSPSSTRTPVASGRDDRSRSSAPGGSAIDRARASPSIAGPPSSGRPSPSTTRPSSAPPRARHAGSARRLDLVVRPHAGERAERHRDGLAAVEADDLASERLAAPLHADDVADAHAGHGEAQAQAGDADDAARRSQRGSSARASPQRVDVDGHVATCRPRRRFPCCLGVCFGHCSSASSCSSSSRARVVSTVGHLDLDDDDERPATAPVEPRDAVPLQGEHRARLRPRRDHERQASRPRRPARGRALESPRRAPRP